MAWTVSVIAIRVGSTSRLTPAARRPDINPQHGIRPKSLHRIRCRGRWGRGRGRRPAGEEAPKITGGISGFPWTR